MDLRELENTIRIVRKLRDPQEGCPWDLKQTHQSLIRFLIEESYECAAALEKNDIAEMKDELGDVLFQVLLHATIAQEKKSFTLEDIAKNLADKLVRRHPHVFNNKEKRIFSEDEIKKNWADIKKLEKDPVNLKDNFFEEDLLSFPSLVSANKIGKKSQSINFDWNNSKEVFSKVEEEIAELKIEIEKNDQLKIEEEIGDVLFSLAQLCRHSKIDPEQCLRKANKKFITRFSKIEKKLGDKSHLFSADQKKLEKLWNEVKKEETSK